MAARKKKAGRREQPKMSVRLHRQALLGVLTILEDPERIDPFARRDARKRVRDHIVASGGQKVLDKLDAEKYGGK